VAEDALPTAGCSRIDDAAVLGARLRMRLGALGLSLLTSAAFGVSTVSRDTPRGCHDGLERGHKHKYAAPHVKKSIDKCESHDYEWVGA